MKEYIERAAAEQVIAAIMPSMSTPDGAGANDEMVFAAQEMCADALSAVHRLPAADVAEVRHGRWIPEICESISKRNRLIEYKVYSCSLCGRSNGRIKKKYCPNCGALMKEDEHEAR